MTDTEAVGAVRYTVPDEELDIRPAERPVCSGCHIEKACNGGCFCDE